ncbi:hypothetical protein [Sinomonas sp. G460-2]|uniref:hypothetical protein n=1 Tax=Sinomonas sp. G460-2 TaxID=3393464 RepID=UPI0039EFEBBA
MSRGTSMALAACIVLTGALTGCGGGSGNPSPPPAGTPNAESHPPQSTSTSSPPSASGTRGPSTKVTVGGFPYLIGPASARAATQLDTGWGSSHVVAPPGQELVTVSVQITNPAQDRTEPLKPNGVVLADPQGGGQSYFLLEVPQPDAPAFGTSFPCTSTVTFTGGAPADYCEADTNDVASTDPAYQFDLDPQIPPGGSVTVLLYVYTPVPTSAPLDKVHVVVASCFDVSGCPSERVEVPKG